MHQTEMIDHSRLLSEYWSLLHLCILLCELQRCGWLLLRQSVYDRELVNPWTTASLILVRVDAPLLPTAALHRVLRLTSYS